MTNSKREYNEFIRANLPYGITYDSARYQYVTFNGKRFVTYLEAKWYIDYLTKFGGFPDRAVGSLFENGEEGVWFEANDATTLFTDVAGTTPVTAPGDAVALQLDKSQGLTLGPELFDTAYFNAQDISATSWTDNGDATYTHDGTSGTNFLFFDGFPFIGGHVYAVSFTVSGATTGTLNAKIDTGATYSVNGNGNYTFYYTAPSGQDGFQFASISGFDGTLSNLSFRELPGNHATQATTAARPEYLATPDRLQLDEVDDNMAIDFGAEFIGTVLQGTPNGVIHYDIDVSDGAWNLTVDPSYVPDGGGITGMIAREGSLTSTEVSNVKTYLQKNGAGDDFAGVTDMSNWFRNRSDITAIYAGDWNISSVTNFTRFARNASSLTTLDVSNWDTSSVTTFLNFVRDASSLTTLDVSNWDTSSVTDFRSFALGASSLTTVTVNGGTGNTFADSPCTNYALAFSDTNLTQQSIDDILVAIELAGTSNGTFDQSGGSAPSSTGEAAITALRGRGWTVTVTGGF